MKMLTIDKLSESNLLVVLQDLFPNADSITKRSFTLPTGKRMIVDYYIEIDDLKMAFEFDGPTHFTRSLTQARDLSLKAYCQENGIILIRIPYFIQIDDRILYWLFGDAIVQKYQLQGKVISTYQHGFIDKKCVLPGDFNPFGQQLFCDIYTSLFDADCAHSMKEIYNNAMLRSKVEFIGLDPIKDLQLFWDNHSTYMKK